MSDLVLDLCAGIGGWTVALRERALSDLAVENNRHAREALRANGVDVYHDDLTTILEDRARVLWLRHNLAGLVASTPCQPFSQANGNAQGLDDPRGNLTLEFGRIATTLRPPFVCLENVGRNTGPLFDYLAGELTAAGYAVDHRLVCAADYGDAQARTRRLLVARLTPLGNSSHALSCDYATGWGACSCCASRIAWPDRTHRDTRTGYDDGRLPWRTLADLLPDRDDLPPWAHRHPSTTIVGSFKPSAIAPPTYRKPGDGPRQNQPGVVIASLEERLAIQGFPDGWHLAGPATARGLQVGNAIPPTLARVALAAALD